MYITLAGLLIIFALLFIFTKLPRIQETDGPDKKLIDFGVLRRSHLRWGVIAQFFYNGGQTAINSLFLVYCCTCMGLSEHVATTFFGFYMLSFLVGRWIGTLLMGYFRPQNMLLVYALANVLLCVIIMTFGGMVGLYAMLCVIRWYGGTLCYALCIVLHVYHVSDTILVSPHRTWRPDKIRFCIPRDGNRR